ncbi:MAG: FkbM family methyltransferase [Anaerolineales bacterium]|nr:FkbM family methyltransferase [Anaerolineales bacterium]MBM2847263.1 FkbM family methyltransferase [Anaerolineales bacterium]
MKIPGRRPSDYLKNLGRIHKYMWYCLKCLFLFKRPFSLLYHYFTLRPPRHTVVELRSGLRIFLSGHAHDLITIFLIFVREDYGQIQPGSIVIDIGANIGVFGLYAAHHQARRVYAYEPNTQSYQWLLRNIAENHLDQVILPHQLAVSRKAGEVVRFPTQASPYNAILTGETTADCELVTTTDLSSILGDHGLESVDLLKLDCEGAEHDIILHTSEVVWRRIHNLRMEYHHGQPDPLMAALQARHFKLTAFRQDTPTSGNMWFRQV